MHSRARKSWDVEARGPGKKGELRCYWGNTGRRKAKLSGKGGGAGEMSVWDEQAARREGGSNCWFQKVEAKVSREAKLGRRWDTVFESAVRW